MDETPPEVQVCGPPRADPPSLEGIASFRGVADKEENGK
jgi:hypothetical protein